MAARKSSRVNRKYKTKYRVTNWRAYERGLRSRRDITVWFSDEAREAWTPLKNGRRGGQPRYSNLAIVTAKTVRMVFHLPIRRFTAHGATTRGQCTSCSVRSAPRTSRSHLDEGRCLRTAPRARGHSGTRPSRRFAMSGAKAGSGSHGIVDRADRAPSIIFSSGASARSETAFVRAATNRRSRRQGSGAMY